MDGYNQQNQGSDQEDLDSSIESVKLNTPIIDAYIIDINKIGTWRHKLDLGRRFDHLASLKMAIRRTHPCFWVNTSSHTQMDRGLIEMNCSSAILGFVWQWGMPLLYCQFTVMKKMMIHNYFLGVPNIFRQSNFLGRVFHHGYWEPHCQVAVCQFSLDILLSERRSKSGNAGRKADRILVCEPRMYS